jgi:kinetochore protein Fta7
MSTVEQLPFPTLKPHVRRIPRQTVSTKWDVLSQAAQEQARELFKAIERPVLMSYRNDRRREEAQSILGSVLRKLTTKIPRMPFPSQTKDIHFNYEMLLDANVCTFLGLLYRYC